MWFLGCGQPRHHSIVVCHFRRAYQSCWTFNKSSKYMTYLNSDSVTCTGMNCHWLSLRLYGINFMVIGSCNWWESHHVTYIVMHLLATKSRFLHYINNWTGFRYTIRSFFPNFCCSFYTISGLLRWQGAKKTGKAPDGSSYLDCAEKDEIKKLLM